MGGQTSPIISSESVPPGKSIAAREGEDVLIDGESGGRTTPKQKRLAGIKGVPLEMPGGSRAQPLIFPTGGGKKGDTRTKIIALSSCDKKDGSLNRPEKSPFLYLYTGRKHTAILVRAGKKSQQRETPKRKMTYKSMRVL